MQAVNLTDGYKVDHRRQYPSNTTKVVTNLTPRKSRVKGVNKVVFFGLQYFIIKYLMDDFESTFFNMDRDIAVKRYKRRIDNYLGKGAVPMEHIYQLYDLGYLPVEVYALPEGSYVPIRVPMCIITTTKDEFFWVTNFLETIFSCSTWLPITSATTAKAYREVLDFWCNMTGGDPEFVPFQGHDFSFRGMAGLEAAMMSGAAHLTSFVGTDTIPAIDFLEQYYAADCEIELVGTSVPATEHSVMCMHTEGMELETFRHLITEVYPSGVVSIVSDTWNLWRVFDYLEELKDVIMARDGKVVIRPDSSWTTPADIVCGLTSHPKLMELDEKNQQRAIKGTVECLWDIFGGTVNAKGYKELDSHIGCIYGDAITLTGCQDICSRLAQKGFASTNMVFGIGSFTYQYVTRDTYGMAFKATYGEVRNEQGEIEGRDIYKNPVTDTGEKVSAKGLVRVYRDATGNLAYEDGCTWEEVVNDSLMELVFRNGDLRRFTTLAEVRETLRGENILQQRLVLE